MTDKHDIDQKLRETLGSPRPLDTERFTERIMPRLREEQSRANGLRRMFTWDRPLHWAIPAMGAAGIIIAAIAIIALISPQPTDDPMQQYITAILTPTPAVQVAMATPDLQTAWDFGPPVPRNRAAAILADTNPENILLEGAMALTAHNDPTLRPHSIWEQAR